MKTCPLCKEKEVKNLLDFGLQPICNNFLKHVDEKEYKHPLIVGQCQACGLVQLINPVPVIKLKPHYHWITYSEPEEHLDHLADIISNLEGLNKKSKICGISFKDDSLLERMKKRGFQNIWRLKTREDLGITDVHIGVETVQDKLNLNTAKEIIKKHGHSDVIIARHILEHSYDLFKFMKTLKELVKQDGYVVIEVPDCAQALENLDYATIWEEHLIYFTPETFRQSFSFVGFSLLHFENFPYAMENSLVGIWQSKKNVLASFPEKPILDKEKQRGQIFAEKFSKKRDELKKYLFDYKKNKGRIALLGAGHLACVFINLLGLKETVEFVIDDNPNKEGLFMPGSHLPIYGSESILKEDIKLCLLGINPRNEDKIIQKNQNFINKEGIFLSIFSGSEHSLPVMRIYNRDKIAKMKQFANGVYYSDYKLIKVGNEEVEFLKEKAQHNERQRSRLCTHKDVNDKIHEMIIVHTKDIYIRPHKHLNKSESFHLIEGSVDVVIFDESGNINEVIQMGDYSSGNKFYYRMNKPFYHTLVINSDYVVFHETTKGPFKKSDTIFAPWSPEEGDSVAVRKFKENLARQVKKFSMPL